MFAVSPRQPASQPRKHFTLNRKLHDVTVHDLANHALFAGVLEIQLLYTYWYVGRRLGTIAGSKVGRYAAKATCRWMFLQVFFRRCFVGLNDVDSEGISEHEGNDFIDLAARR